MSSSELQNIIDTIEGQDTDHFGKFYLYVSLLHKATVRDQRTFASLLPRHNGGLFHKSRSVDVGSNLIELPGSIDAYSQQFNGKTYDPVNSAVTLVSTYFRTGKIMDLISIVKQMYSHLSLIERELTANNRKIFDKLDFSHKQHQLLPLLQQLNQISDQYISMTDSAIKKISYLIQHSRLRFATLASCIRHMWAIDYLIYASPCSLYTLHHFLMDLSQNGLIIQTPSNP
jgi:hypothetical protein